MLEEEAAHEKAMKEMSNESGKLKKMESQAIGREKARQKYKTTMRNKEQFKIDSEDVIKKMRDQYESGLSGLSKFYEEERKKQMEELQERLRNRKEDVVGHKARMEEERIQKAKEEADA